MNLFKKMLREAAAAALVLAARELAKAVRRKVSVRWTAPESQARRGPLALDGARPSADAQSPST